MAPKTQKTPLLFCILVPLFILIVPFLVYLSFTTWSDHNHLQFYSRAFDSWASSSKLSSNNNNMMFRMSSTSYDPTRKQEIFEENRALVTFKDDRVYVNCPPCNITSHGLFNPKDVPGLRIRSSPHIEPPISILLAIFTDPGKFELRSTIRMAYSLQTCTDAIVDVIFVMDSPKSEQDAAFVGSEIRLFNDILLVDTSKPTMVTYNFFTKIYSMNKMRHDYVMKMEDDSYVRLSNLAQSLAKQPREGLYYGYVLPCENQDAYKYYMAGMGYVLSWDLVEYIGNVTIKDFREESQIQGREDTFIGDLLNYGGKATKRVNKKPLFYDHPDFGGACAHDLVKDTILVHQITDTKRWVDVLIFFEPQLLR